MIETHLDPKWRKGKMKLGDYSIDLFLQPDKNTNTYYPGFIVYHKMLIYLSNGFSRHQSVVT